MDERFLAPVADCLVGQDNADRTTPNQCATARGCVAFDHWLSHEKKATTDILKTELKMFNKSLRGKSWAESRVTSAELRLSSTKHNFEHAWHE